MARTVGDTQLPTNVPPVNAPNGRRLSVTLPRCAAAFAIAPPPAGRHGGGCPSTKPRPFALPLGRFLRPMSDVTLPMRSCLRHRSPMRSKARPGNARERRDDAFNVIRHVGLPALPYLPSFTETRSDARTILSRVTDLGGRVWTPLARQTAAASIQYDSGLAQGPAAHSPGRVEVRQKNCRCDRPLAAMIDGGTRGREPMFGIRRGKFIVAPKSDSDRHDPTRGDCERAQPA